MSVQIRGPSDIGELKGPITYHRQEQALLEFPYSHCQKLGCARTAYKSSNPVSVIGTMSFGIPIIDQAFLSDHKTIFTDN